MSKTQEEVELFTLNGLQVVPIKVFCLSHISHGDYIFYLHKGYCQDQVFQLGKDIFTTSEEASDFKLKELKAYENELRDKLGEAKENIKAFKKRSGVKR